MGYQNQMQDDILGLMRLFRGLVPDAESHGWVSNLASNRSEWGRAKEVFDRVRRRNLAAISSKDRVASVQYYFEEVCLQSLYNETAVDDPFDSCTPYWIIKNALDLARRLDVPEARVVRVVQGQHLEDEGPESTCLEGEPSLLSRLGRWVSRLSALFR